MQTLTVKEYIESLPEGKQLNAKAALIDGWRLKEDSFFNKRLIWVAPPHYEGVLKFNPPLYNQSLNLVRRLELKLPSVAPEAGGVKVVSKSLYINNLIKQVGNYCWDAITASEEDRLTALIKTYEECNALYT